MNLKIINRQLLIRLVTLPVIFFLQLTIVLAETTKEATTKPAHHNSLVILMIVIMLILLLAIGLMSHVLRGAMDIYREKMIKERTGTGTTTMTVILLLISSSVFAETPAGAASGLTSFDMGGLSPIAFYLMWTVIGLELLVLFAMIINLKIILGFKKQARPVKEKAAESKTPVKSLWEKMNSFKPVEKEAEIELSHSYDGIRELDNRLPPWWLYGFYVTIIFSVIYLWRFHVSHSEPTQEQEFIAAMEVAEVQKQAFLKQAANQVDESTVKFLDGAGDLSAGKALFETNCTACHGKSGEGIVGPNLTDAYWLHGGAINDVFKSIKYGIPEKGMRNWNEDFSPVQIAQLASYIKSIHGTNPPNAKEKQGELFEEAKSVSATGTQTGLVSGTN